MDQTPVEILVHIAAPGRAADDVRYRSLAAAYVDFQPAARHPLLQDIGVSEGQPPGHVASSQSPRQTAAIASTPLRGHAFQPNQGTPIGSFASIQASFQSVIDNVGSPRVTRRLHQTPSQASIPSSAQTSWLSPGSLVGDSQPEFSSIHAEHVSPTRLLEHYLQGFGSPSTSSLSPSQRTSKASDGSQIPSHLSPSSHHSSGSRPRAQQDNSPPQRVAPSASFDDESHESSLSFAELKPVSAVDHAAASTRATADAARSNAREVGPNITRHPLIARTIAASSSRPLSAGSRVGSEPPTGQTDSGETTRVLHHAALSRATSDLGPRSSGAYTSSNTQVVFFPVHGYTLESLELRAPEPPVASLSVNPEDFVTPQLRELLADAQPRRKAQPKEQTRDLRPTERGYWRVDCSSWDDEVKRATWAHLANWVGMGFTGWGTRCTRDAEFRSVRVYCWGETAPYMYYLLWLTSYRKILTTECAWIDADGQAVIIMGVRK